MRKSLARPIAVVTIAASVSLGGLVLKSAEAAGQCPNNNWSNLDGATDNYFQYNGVNIRTGNDIACTSLGHGQKSHQVVLHCSRFNGSNWWTHVKDKATGVSGWVRFDQLWSEHLTPC